MERVVRSASDGRRFHFRLRPGRHLNAGRSGLVAVPTGSGKTYAAVGGPLLRA